MRVPGNDQPNSALRAREGGSPAAPQGQTGWESRRHLSTGVGPAGREGVVKARLSILLAALGELPAQFPTEQARPGQGLAHLIDDMCSATTPVIHAKLLPLCSLDLEHLVVAPRGLVVVSPEWAPAPPKGPRTDVPPGRVRSASARSGGPEERRRSRLVREALRRANALRAWLETTPWAGTPVWAAVCSAPVLGPPPSPPVVLDGLWLGDLQRLPAWLGTGADLDAPDRAALGYYLSAELPAS
jgi:hypothetical protein